MRRWSRLDLTPLLDILLNAFLIVLVQLDATGRQQTSEAREEAAQAEGQLTAAIEERDALHRARDEAEQRWRDAEAARLEAATQASRMAEILQEAGHFGAMSADEQAAMAQLMRTQMTVVQFSISRDAVRSYRVLPQEAPVTLEPPVALTRLEPSPTATAEADYPRVYEGRTLIRLLQVLDNNLHQRGPQDRVFYVFANDGENSCVALNGLDAEVRELPDLSVLVRPHGCR